MTAIRFRWPPLSPPHPPTSGSEAGFQLNFCRAEGKMAKTWHGTVEFIDAGDGVRCGALGNWGGGKLFLSDIADRVMLVVVIVV